MKQFIQKVLFCVLVGAPFISSAALIDFESFTDYQNLNGVDLGGVTLYNSSNNVEVFDNRFGVSSHSGTKAIGSFSGPQSINPLTGIFSSAVSYVSLWAGDGGNDTDNWTLNLFDAVSGGNLLGSYNSGNWNGNPYTQLSGSFANIWRFEAVWNGPSCCGVGFDDLEFTPSSVPEPSSIALLSLGLFGISFLRNRKA